MGWCGASFEMTDGGAAGDWAEPLNLTLAPDTLRRPDVHAGTAVRPGERAAYLGSLDSLGTIQPGRLADLVLLDADPLADIRNTRRIHRVIANGRVMDRAALLRRAEAFARR
jgi:imidazolonepropionase-like amidohydrolase